MGKINGIFVLWVCLTVLMLLISVAPNSKNVSTDGSDRAARAVRSQKASATHTRRSEGEILQSSNNLKSFTYAELKAATRNFRHDSVLGEGGFGSFFKGWIDEQSLTDAKPSTGIVIAVKRLKQDSLQGHNEWLVSAVFALKTNTVFWCMNLCLEAAWRVIYSGGALISNLSLGATV